MSPKRKFAVLTIASAVCVTLGWLYYPAPTVTLQDRSAPSTSGLPQAQGLLSNTRTGSVAEDEASRPHTSLPAYGLQPETPQEATTPVPPSLSPTNVGEDLPSMPPSTKSALLADYRLLTRQWHQVSQRLRGAPREAYDVAVNKFRERNKPRLAAQKHYLAVDFPAPPPEPFGAPNARAPLSFPLAAGGPAQPPNPVITHYTKQRDLLVKERDAVTSGPANTPAQNSAALSGWETMNASRLMTDRLQALRLQQHSAETLPGHKPKLLPP